MDLKEADGSYDKDSDKLRCAIEHDLTGLSQGLRKLSAKLRASIYH